MDKYNSFFNTQKKPSSIFGEVGCMDSLIHKSKSLKLDSLEKELNNGRKSGEFGSSFFIRLGVYSLKEQQLVSNQELIDKIYDFNPRYLKKAIGYEFLR